MKLIPVVMITTGLILIFASVTDRNPLEIVKAAIRGEDLPEEGSLSGDAEISEELEQEPGEDEDWHHAPGDEPAIPPEPEGEWT